MTRNPSLPVSGWQGSFLGPLTFHDQGLAGKERHGDLTRKIDRKLTTVSSSHGSIQRAS